MNELKRACLLLSSEYAVMSEFEDHTPHILVFSLFRNVGIGEVKIMLKSNKVSGLRVVNHVIPIHHRDSVRVELL